MYGSKGARVLYVLDPRIAERRLEIENHLLIIKALSKRKIAAKQERN